MYVAKNFSCDQYSIPGVLSGNTRYVKDEAIGLIFPCYVGSTPTLVCEFMEQVKLESDYIFAIMTYGNTSLGALHHVDLMARKNGITLSYLNKVLMVDSSIKYFDMAQQIRDQHEKEIDKNISRICEQVNAREISVGKPGFVMGQVSKLTHHLYKKEIGDVDRKYRVESHCNGCGVCSDVCPVSNIKPGNPPVFRHRCIRCYACTHNCPKNAIRFSNEKSRARFRNENVSLKEIIKANRSNSTRL